MCFDRDDWDSMIAATLDDDSAAAQRLLDSGACRMIRKETTVRYLDPASGGAALIQMPSGKAAYTLMNFLR